MFTVNIQCYNEENQFVLNVMKIDEVFFSNCKLLFLKVLKLYLFLFQHTDLSQYVEKHPGGLNAFNIKVFLSIFYSLVLYLWLVCLINTSFLIKLCDPVIQILKTMYTVYV